LFDVPQLEQLPAAMNKVSFQGTLELGFSCVGSSIEALAALLRHVQQLFEVPQLEQLPAAMNKVSA
jgi:hypothetical protein